MSFIVLMALLSLPPLLFIRWRAGHWQPRMAMCFGMAGGFLFTGIDHFLNTETRYIPMMPEFLAPWARELVWLTGAAEILGAVGLLLPVALWSRFGLPDMRRITGLALSLLLALMVVANVNVALQGTQVAGLPFGSWYYWLRPALQPLIILWALFASGVWPRRPATRSL